MGRGRRPLESIENEVMKEVARELDLPLRTVKDMVINGQSAFTAHIMKSNTFHGVKWPFFGTFKVKPKKVQIDRYKMGMTKQQKKLFVESIKRGEWKYDETAETERRLQSRTGKGDVDDDT